MRGFAEKIGCKITSPIRHKPTHYEKIDFVKGNKINIFDKNENGVCKAPLDLQLVSDEIIAMMSK